MKWYRSLLIICVLFGLVAARTANAQEPIVRTNLENNSTNTDDTVWVGQQVTLTVELLVPGYFASSASFDLPDPAGVLLMPPATHPLVSNETINDVLYTVQRHKLRAWPMRACTQSIPAFNVRFSYKRNPLDTDEIAATETTDAQSITVTLPPGADNIGTVISARDLTLKESWQPQPDSDAIEAGKALTRTITFSAPDVPGMLFPPFSAGNIDGLGIYTKQQINDKDERGIFTGEREDNVTYVLKRPGQFTIPAVNFTWFDLDAKTLKTDVLPAQTFNVIANPDMASENIVNASAKKWWPLLIITGLFLVAVFFTIRNQRLRRWFVSVITPLKPVHLQPLNPSIKNTVHHQ